MLIDYHSHTPLCGHAEGPVEAYVERAIELGFEEFGISDHCPWIQQNPGEWIGMNWDELDAYVESIRALQARYNRDGDRPFRVRMGMEIDYLPRRMDLAHAVIERYEWDYLLGVVHHVGLMSIATDRNLDLFGKYRVEDICECYFDLVGRMVSERFGDIIAHLDLPKKFGNRPEGGLLPYVEPLIPAILESGMAVEINTSGHDHDVGEAYPSWDIIEALAAANVPLVLGSDAHAPHHVGRHFAKTLEGLRERGVKQLVRFENRRPHPIPLPTASEPHLPNR